MRYTLSCIFPSKKEEIELSDNDSWKQCSQRNLPSRTKMLTLPFSFCLVSLGIVPYCHTWSPIVQYGLYYPVWFPMVLYGAIWSYMVWYGLVRSLMVQCVPVWSHMFPFGPIWSPMVPYGPLWFLWYPMVPYNTV